MVDGDSYAGTLDALRCLCEWKTLRAARSGCSVCGLHSLATTVAARRGGGGSPFLLEKATGKSSAAQFADRPAQAGEAELSRSKATDIFARVSNYSSQ